MKVKRLLVGLTLVGAMLAPTAAQAFTPILPANRRCILVPAQLVKYIKPGFVACVPPSN